MTIKTKLIANVLITSAIIIGMSLASFVSMRFLQEKLSYLTEKSTPFQMRTVEFQRELQGSITNLIKVNAARNMQEYTTSRAEAEMTLGNVRKAQRILEKMNGGLSRFAVSEELDPIADELFGAVEARIKSDISASEANAKVSQQMKESSTRLKELETNIRNLQAARSAAFAKALESTGQLSARLRELEELRNQFKELLFVSNSSYNVQNSTALLIEKGKIRTLFGLINGNNSSKFISSDLKTLADDMNGFLQLQAAAVSKKDDDSDRWVLEALKDLSEMINRINLTLNQEIELASSKLAIETQRQGIIFAQSNSANSTLLNNSELVALGLTVTGDINRLFTFGSPTELVTFDSDIRPIFASIHERARLVEGSLARLDAKNELKLLHAAIASLAAIRSGLYSADGIVATLKKKLNAGEQADRSADKLHAIVIRQLAKGSESVSVAQEEQEKSIAKVNDIVRQSLSRIFGIGAVAIAIGILFGFWIYRSVLLPLRAVLAAVRSQQKQVNEKAGLAETIASGDLTQEVIISEAITLDPARMKYDEMGMVLKAIVSMSEAQITLDVAFAGMTASLRSSRAEEASRSRLKSGLYELNKILRDNHINAKLADEALAFIADFVGAGVGIMYLYDEKEEMLQTISTYAISRSERLGEGFRLGEGLVGQAAREQKVLCLNSIPPDYLRISSALGEAAPLNVAIMPIMHNDILVGVLELGSFRHLGDEDFEFLNHSLEGIAIAIRVNHSHQLVNDLLEQTQAQAEELRAQQEELQKTNESRSNGQGCRRKQK